MTWNQSTLMFNMTFNASVHAKNFRNKYMYNKFQTDFSHSADYTALNKNLWVVLTHKFWVLFPHGCSPKVKKNVNRTWECDKKQFGQTRRLVCCSNNHFN